MMRVAFLNPTIPPRVVSLLNKISNSEDISIKAFFFAESQKNRDWNLNSGEYEAIKFPYQILESFSFGFGFKDFHNSFINFSIWRHLSIFNPDIVLLPGWADIASLSAFFWAKRHRKKIILRSESTEYEHSFRRSLFIPYTTFICQNVDLIIASSHRAQKYARTLAPATNITTIWSSFDTEKFNHRVLKLRKKKKRVKEKLGIQQKRVYYFNGQSIERKGIKPLLQAFSKLENQNLALVLTGKGILDTYIEQMVKNHPNIYQFGYQTQDQLPSFYAIADYFILPSFEETWGLVIVEALAAGLPVIVSENAGSSELIESRKQGIVIGSVDKNSITKAIYKLPDPLSVEYKKMSDACQSLALNELSYKKISLQFIAEFKKLFLER